MSIPLHHGDEVDEGLSILEAKGYPAILREQIEGRYFERGEDGIFQGKIVTGRNDTSITYRRYTLPAGSAAIFLQGCIDAPSVIGEALPYYEPVE